jgi:hypothetical protein
MIWDALIEIGIGYSPRWYGVRWFSFRWLVRLLLLLGICGFNFFRLLTGFFWHSN